MEELIVTWYYEQSASEGGQYAQVRGDSSSESFRDVYRRCVAVFFATARRTNPDARLVLYTNTPWDKTRSRTARDVARILDELSVSTVVVAYSHAPPNTWPGAWRNQFYVFDVMADLCRRYDQDDCIVLLDSDVLWGRSDMAIALWRRIRAHDVICYDVGYPRSYRVNGLSRDELTSATRNLGITGEGDVIRYMGGEFIAGTVCGVSNVLVASEHVYAGLKDRHIRDNSFVFEEAHILSTAYAILRIDASAGGLIRRIWTQPLKPRNVARSDLELALWHVPAEKKYGIRRVYNRINGRGNLDRLINESDVQFLRQCARQVGIPKMSPLKLIRDVSIALRLRIVPLVTPKSWGGASVGRRG